ncbi:MAG: hypothetical protein AB1428_00605 [Bacteroidota bacterium]
MRRLLIIACMTIVSCVGRTGGGARIIATERFSGLYAGLLEIGQTGKLAGWDSTRVRQAVDSLLVHEGVTRDEYRTTVAWLNDDLSRWRAVAERTERILEERAGGMKRR